MRGGWALAWPAWMSRQPPASDLGNAVACCTTLSTCPRCPARTSARRGLALDQSLTVGLRGAGQRDAGRLRHHALDELPEFWHEQMRQARSMCEDLRREVQAGPLLLHIEQNSRHLDACHCTMLGRLWHRIELLLAALEGGRSKPAKKIASTGFSSHAPRLNRAASAPAPAPTHPPVSRRRDAARARTRPRWRRWSSRRRESPRASAARCRHAG